MRSQGGRPKINPIEDVKEVKEFPHNGRVEALFDQNLFRMQLQRERSAAFWFAASIWGISGLVIGACFGAYVMYMAYTGLSGPVRDNIMDGFVARQAVDSNNSRDPVLDQNTPSE